MVGQQGFWDEAERLAKLTRKKPSLERLKAAIPWEEFRPLLESAFAKERKSPAGRKLPSSGPWPTGGHRSGLRYRQNLGKATCWVSC